MLKIIAGLIAVFLSTPVLAAATPWQNVAPSVKMRLISTDTRSANGTTYAALEIAMPPNFKTYWRLPGEVGIPTQLDIAGSKGVTAAKIRWPYPAPEMTNGYLDFVYHGPTVLPIALQVAGPDAVLQAGFFLGVCSDICVPVKASFSLPLRFTHPDMANGVRISQARALVPIAWPGKPAFGAISFDPVTKALRVTGLAATIAPNSIIASTPDPTLVFNAPQKSPDTGALEMALRGPIPPGGWKPQPVRLTFMTPEGAYEVSRTVASSTP